jgi:hypothetical protein
MGMSAHGRFALSGSGDCPLCPWCYATSKIHAELRDWRYQKPQSPTLSSNPDARPVSPCSLRHYFVSFTVPLVLVAQRR